MPTYEAMTEKSEQTEVGGVILQRTGMIAKLALLLATIIWGSSFIVMKDALDNLGTFYLLGVRFMGCSHIIGSDFLVQIQII